MCVLQRPKTYIGNFILSKGAPTVAELKSMKKEAADANVEICSKYNILTRLCFVYLLQ